MKKEKVSIEKELKSRSANIIWPLISTAAGLEKWVADEVINKGDRLQFTWGEVWQPHEIRTARILERVKNSHVRYCWDNDTDEDAYWELEMRKSEITDDYILIITDFALPEDVDGLEDLWEINLNKLRHRTGL